MFSEVEIKKFMREGIGALTTMTSDTGTTMFIGQEVAELWGHTNLTQAIKAARLVEKDYKVIDLKKFTEFKEQLTNLKLVGRRASFITLIAESGLYKLALASSLPGAIVFKDWVASEVLPAIRQHGSYSIADIHISTIVEQTSRTIQIANSKAVNTKHFEEKGLPETIAYNIENCKQVTGITPAQVKRNAGKKSKSAKQILRDTAPELSAAMSLNDWLVANKNAKLSDLKKLDEAAITVFRELGRIGINVIEE